MIKLSRKFKHKPAITKTGKRGPLAGQRWQNKRKKIYKYVLGLATCFFLILGIGFAGLYFLVQGKAGKNSSLLQKVEGSFDELLSDDFEVDIKTVDVNVTFTGNTLIQSNNVSIKRKDSDQVFARIGRINIELGFLSVVSGANDVKYIGIDEGELDVSALSLESDFELPKQLNTPFNEIGKTLADFRNYIEEQEFRQLQITNSTIVGSVMGRKQTDPILIENLTVDPLNAQQFKLNANLKTDSSNIMIKSLYDATAEEGASYEFTAKGINLSEWLHDPSQKEGVIAADGVVDVATLIRFREDNTAFDPNFNIVTSNNNIRLGRKAVAKSEQIELNLRMILALNQIELDPSHIEIGRFTADLIGGVKPFDSEKGYNGPLLYDFIANQAKFDPITPDEEGQLAGFKIAGLYDPFTRELAMNELVMSTKSGAIQGNGVIGFHGKTPAVKASLATSGISVLALKQFWPFFTADKARIWIHDHVFSGHVVSGRMDADIPAGIVFLFDEGKKLKPEHYKAVLKVKDFTLHPFGELPPIHKGKGVITMEGMQISADFNEGEVYSQKDTVKVDKAHFLMRDFADKPRIGEVDISISGKLGAISRLSNHKPLSIMERLKVKAEQFSGQGDLNVAVKFPIIKGVKYEQIDWSALMNLRDGKSSKPLAGRSISGANLLIDANRNGAKAEGTAMVDNVKTKIQLVEPMGNSGKIKRSRKVSSVLNKAEQKKLGVDLEPVVSGPVSVTVEEQDKVQKFTVDLTAAEVNLPWVGWVKGKKIDAKASFTLKTNKNSHTLDNFLFSGQGFSAKGKLTLDKQGLISADMRHVSLNVRDKLSLRVKRRKGAYDIDATGQAYDARGLMNTLIYKGVFTESQQGRSVNLNAKFGQVFGFENRALINLNLVYQSKKGNLDLINLKAQDTTGGYYSVEANRVGDSKVRFVIDSSNAGNGLAFTNIYSHMHSGHVQGVLEQKGNGPYQGGVNIRQFDVVDDPRLKHFSSSVRQHVQSEDGERRKVILQENNADHRVRFTIAESYIEKGKGYMNLHNSIIRSRFVGLTANGTLYNQQDKINLTGTFIPALGVNDVVSSIPIIGDLLSQKRNPFIGITYKLKGDRNNPELLANPISIVAPGVFKKVFEYNN